MKLSDKVKIYEAALQKIRFMVCVSDETDSKCAGIDRCPGKIAALVLDQVKNDVTTKVHDHLTRDHVSERDEALEEAAQLCDEAASVERRTLAHLGHDHHTVGRIKQAEKLAVAIRSLKDKP